jgi:hypothetical protein
MCRTIETGATTYRTLEAMNTKDLRAESCSVNRFATAPTAATTKSTLAAARRPRRARDVRRASRTVAIWANRTTVAPQRSDSDVANT